ncbi:helicase-exonuclease AddAB subunit AddA [Tetragenococcus solitarius]|uniref:ATP-dependent helicase/nuclease subunit A n=1 Tax=Tetragenococcus solitarius TaxID=71453 RepID=A0ABN3XYT8_9ENTE|nr:helicase-exonuclease AddAB subunit AddA [Tetragenococcus solitarius]
MANIPLKPKNETFTDKQWQAVFDRGDNLLVSASAGSGKTTVLVRRVIEKLKNGSNIDELLIVTFTEAAAREMKERIQSALQDAINKESQQQQRNHFVKQLTLLPRAHISTLHAFCLSVIRRFYFLIDLDPVFRMLTDDTERLLLKDEVWEELRDSYFETYDEDFYQLAENFSNDRSDDGFTDLIMSLYNFARANPDPTNWLNQLAKSYDTTKGLAGNQMYQAQVKPLVLADLQTAINQLEAALEIAQGSELMKKAEEVLTNDLTQAKNLQTNIEKENVQQAYEQLSSFDFKRYPSYKKEEAKELSNSSIKPRRDSAKELIQETETFFAYSPEKMLELMDQAKPLIEKMSEVTLNFIDKYQKRKQTKGVLDFNDLEHFTLDILQGDGKGSEASDYYRERFEEVLVDEYQDTNRLQEAILFWLRNPEPTQGNLFMVGDVKQSIYAFRLADPTLFVDKYLAFAKQAGGRRIILAENFRSRKEVLEFTNLVFEQLMDETVGQIPYDKAAQLIPGYTDFPASKNFNTELLLYEKEVEDDPIVVDDKTEGELYLVALKIKELVENKFMIYDKNHKENRPVNYSDIVLLTPTRKNNLMIMDVFKQFQIPMEVNDAQNYFQATEIQTMISLLEIIDNPYQDIPFAAVLRSPLVGANEEDLAKIRLAQKEGDYYEAFLAYLSEKDELAKHLSSFNEQLEMWRSLARRRSLSELIWSIYQETAYLDYVIGLPSGRQRYANLIALAHRAETYEKSSFRGLYQFIRFIEKMQEKDKDLAEPLALSQENAVKVMTIHASKGLEFPIVFLLDMSKQFNYSDFSTRYIFEERLGAGIQYIDQEQLCYDTLPYQAIKQQRIQKMLSEEMRKLYVALTRAEQKLYLVGSYKNKEEALKCWQKALDQENLVLDPALRLKGKANLMDWVGMTLMRHPDMKKVFLEAADSKKVVDHPAHFEIHWMNQAQLAEAIKKYQTQAVQSRSLSSPEKAEVNELKQRLNFVYPLQKSSKTTSYQSVSEMKRLYNDPDDQQFNKISWQSTFDQQQTQHYRYVSEELAKPKFIQQDHIDPAAIGSAMHSLLQLLPLTTTPTLDNIQQKLELLVDHQQIEEQVAKRMDLSAILWFFQTDLGKEILNNPELVQREQPFSMLKDARDVFFDFDESAADLLIHGIVDGLIEYEDCVILYDFKTDVVYNDTYKQQVIAKYKGQLRLYCEALEQALDKPVAHTFLVLLNSKEIIEMFFK